MKYSKLAVMAAGFLGLIGCNKYVHPGMTMDAKNQQAVFSGQTGKVLAELLHDEYDKVSYEEALRNGVVERLLIAEDEVDGAYITKVGVNIDNISSIYIKERGWPVLELLYSDELVIQTKLNEAYPLTIDGFFSRSDRKIKELAGIIQAHIEYTKKQGG